MALAADAKGRAAEARRYDSEYLLIESSRESDMPSDEVNPSPNPMDIAC